MLLKNTYRYLLFFLLLSGNCFLFSNCCSTPKKTKKKVENRKFPSVWNIVNGKHSTWNNNKQGISSAILHFNFQKYNELKVEFSPDCIVSFPIVIRGNRIETHWHPTIESTKEYEIVKAINKAHSSYKNTRFMVFYLKNDTTLIVEYRTANLRNKLNATAKDRILFTDKYYFFQPSKKDSLNQKLELIEIQNKSQNK